MLYNSINTAEQLQREFISYDRNYYSIEACEAILDYFDSIDENVELDIIGLCGDFNEDTLDEIINNYNIEIDGEEEEFANDEEYFEFLDYKEEQVFAFLDKNTWAVKTVDDKILYTVF
jgi:hypothetical protein